MSNNVSEGLAQERASLGRTRTVGLLAGLLSLFFMGLIFSWSIFTTPIANDTGWSTETLSLNFRVIMMMYAVGCLASSGIQRKCNGQPRIPILVGGALVVAGFALMGALSGMGIAAVFVFYGGLAAFGAGIVFNAIFTTNNLWFPDKVGMVSGLQMFAFGIASLLLGVGIDALMNQLGWRAVLAGLGALDFALAAVAAFLLKAPPADIDRVFPGKAAAASQGAGADDAGASASGTGAPASANPHFLTDFGVSKTSFTIADMLKSAVFWIGLVWFVCVASIGVTLLGESRQDALAIGAPATLATLIVGLLSLFNGGSSIVLGVLFDRFGLVNHVRLTTVVSVVGVCLVTLAFVVGNVPLFFAGAIIVAVGYGGLPVFGTTFTLNRYGREHYAANCALGTAFLVPASLASMVLAPAFRSIGGLTSMYAGFVVVIAVGVAFLLAFVRKYRSDMEKLV